MGFVESWSQTEGAEGGYPHTEVTRHFLYHPLMPGKWFCYERRTWVSFCSTTACKFGQWDLVAHQFVDEAPVYSYGEEIPAFLAYLLGLARPWTYGRDEKLDPELKRWV